VVDVVMVPFRSESADALRACADRLCELATEQRLKEIPGARQELERALESLTSQADALQLERDDARAETTRAELSLTAARQILEEGPDGYLVTDSTGVILQANRSAAQLLGVSPRFLARKPLSLFIDEADLRMFRWRVNNVHTRGPSEWPVRLRPRQGSPIVAGLSVAPFKMGEPKSDLRWFVRDITVRQRAEEFAATQEFTAQMLDSERTARAEAESARAGLELQADVGGALAESLDYVAALSRVGALVVPAAADVFVADLLVSGALEQITTACVTAPDAERLRSRRPPDPASDHPIAQAIRTGRPVLATEITSAWLESWAPSPESRELWQSIAPTTIAVVPIRSHRQIHGALTFAFGPSGRHHSPATLRVLEDIGLRTALALDTAQLFRALEAEQRHRDEFLAMLAHELRNPLAAVSNGLAALERVDPQTRVQLLQILSRQSKHLARLLNDLLDVSGVRFGRVTLERRRLDVRELARQTLDVFEASGKTAKLSVDLRLDSRPVYVVGDADRLEQVIANLLDNAVKYTPSPGSIELSVAGEGDDAVVRVRDSGVGIAAEFLPRIFEVFSRGTRDPGQESPGLGLGLSVVRDLVVKHGGTVLANSAGTGKGSEFVVRLPLAPDR
jgi:PAS domain S-box-containing protein